LEHFARQAHRSEKSVRHSLGRPTNSTSVLPESECDRFARSTSKHRRARADVFARWS
jgi:hypothetical protein